MWECSALFENVSKLPKFWRCLDSELAHGAKYGAAATWKYFLWVYLTYYQISWYLPDTSEFMNLIFKPQYFQLFQLTQESDVTYILFKQKYAFHNVLMPRIICKVIIACKPVFSNFLPALFARLHNSKEHWIFMPAGSDAYTTNAMMHHVHQKHHTVHALHTPLHQTSISLHCFVFPGLTALQHWLSACWAKEAFKVTCTRHGPWSSPPCTR